MSLGAVCALVERVEEGVPDHLDTPCACSWRLEVGELVAKELLH